MRSINSIWKRRDDPHLIIEFSGFIERECPFKRVGDTVYLGKRYIFIVEKGTRRVVDIKRPPHITSKVIRIYSKFNAQLTRDEAEERIFQDYLQKAVLSVNLITHDNRTIYKYIGPTGDQYTAKSKNGRLTIERVFCRNSKQEFFPLELTVNADAQCMFEIFQERVQPEFTAYDSFANYISHLAEFCKLNNVQQRDNAGNIYQLKQWLLCISNQNVTHATYIPYLTKHARQRAQERLGLTKFSDLQEFLIQAMLSGELLLSPEDKIIKGLHTIRMDATYLFFNNTLFVISKDGMRLLTVMKPYS